MLEFQPAVDLATGRLLGFEALLRWQHPKRGVVGPRVLIPWAEANGTIDALNHWVMVEAARQATAWPSGIQLAVNCSVVQLRHRHASWSAREALEVTGLNPDRLTLEVTESAMADPGAHADLHQLASVGIHLAVDDVGTSWSTLENLQRFSIETAKIDRSFIGALEPTEGMNRAIVEAIIHVSHSMARSTVAEGVETVQQVQILREFGADVAQGYFFARPLPVGETLALALQEPRACFALGPGVADGSALAAPA